MVPAPGTNLLRISPPSPPAWAPDIAPPTIRAAVTAERASFFILAFLLLGLQRERQMPATELGIRKSSASVRRHTDNFRKFWVDVARRQASAMSTREVVLFRRRHYGTGIDPVLKCSEAL